MSRVDTKKLGEKYDFSAAEKAREVCTQCGYTGGTHKAGCSVLSQKPGTFSLPNTSGLHPLGVAVLVKPYEPEINKSLLVMPETVKERTSAVETRAIVIAVGPLAWSDEPQPRARLGDKVLISRFAGVVAIGPKDGERYRLVNDRDIFCGLEE